MKNCIDLRGRGFMLLEPIPFEKFIGYESCILRHYTSSALIDRIQKDGLLPPSQSNIKPSNFDLLSSDEDKDYIYLTGNEDYTFANNAVSIHGGKPVVLTVKVTLKSIEIDNYGNVYSSQGIDLKDMNIIHKKLTTELFRNCRTKDHIKPENILDIAIND
jgi:hypothetical protein